MMKLLIFFSGVLFLSIALVSCSIPKAKEGKLKVEADGLIADIEEQGGFESANIRWQTLATNDSDL